MSGAAEFSPEVEARTVHPNTSPAAFKAACDEMREARRQQSADAVEAMQYASWDAANVFGLLNRMLSSGLAGTTDAGVISLTALCASALKLQADRDDLMLENLVRFLRDRPEALEPATACEGRNV